MTEDKKQLLKKEKETIEKLRKIVEESAKAQNHLIDSWAKSPEDKSSLGERLSDGVAKFGGSWFFIITFLLLLIIWILFNTFFEKDRFDPFPFILLNLILSCIAAIQAPIIMMSQNRQEAKDRKRSENDYFVNLNAELEIRVLHEKIDLLLSEHIKMLYETQEKQLELLKQIEKKINTI